MWRTVTYPPFFCASLSSVDPDLCSFLRRIVLDHILEWRTSKIRQNLTNNRSRSLQLVQTSVGTTWGFLSSPWPSEDSLILSLLLLWLSHWLVMVTLNFSTLSLAYTSRSLLPRFQRKCDLLAGPNQSFSHQQSRPCIHWWRTRRNCIPGTDTGKFLRNCVRPWRLRAASLIQKHLVFFQ